MSHPKVSVIMGSQTDWPTMSKSIEVLDGLLIPSETQIISAHRTPERLYRFAHEVKGRGVQVIIAGASGAAHLPGMVAAMTSLPVLGVPITSAFMQGLDSLLSIIQMPGGVPVGTLAIGEAGAKNAALLAASILALSDDELAERLDIWRKQQTALVAAQPTR